MEAPASDATPSRNTPPVSGDVTDSDEFRMYYWKILPCRKRYSHDWSDCVFAHNGEKVQRRCPRKHNYKGFMCPDMKKGGSCPRGDMCGFAHNSFEYWLHPTRYRTELCTFGTSCKRSVCFFAHTPAEQRLPSTIMGPPSTKGGGSPGGSSPDPPTTTPPSTPPTTLAPSLAIPSAAPPASPSSAPLHRHSTGQLPLRPRTTTPSLVGPVADAAPWPVSRPSLTFQPASSLAPMAAAPPTPSRRLRSASATTVPMLRPTADSIPTPRPTLAPLPSPRLLPPMGPTTPTALRPVQSPSSTPPRSPLLHPMPHHHMGHVYAPQPHPTHLSPNPTNPYDHIPQMLPPPSPQHHHQQQQYMQYATPDLQQYMGAGTSHQQYLPELPPMQQYDHHQLLTPEDALRFGDLTVDDLSQVDQSHYGSGRKWSLQQLQPPPPMPLGAPFSPINEAAYYPITTAPVPGSFHWPHDY